MKTYTSPEISFIEIGENSLICASLSESKSIAKKNNIDNLGVPKTYWEKYVNENPDKAKEIMLLGLDFENMPDKDVKEKISVLEMVTKGSKYSISEIKNHAMDYYSTHIQESDYLYLLEKLDKASSETAIKYNVEKRNTLEAMLETWVLEKIEDIEKKYSSLSPRSRKDSKDLLLYFSLESDNDLLTFRKIHIYTLNFPLSLKAKRYLEDFHRAIDEGLSKDVREYTTNSSVNVGKTEFNIALSTLFHKRYNSLTENCQDGIDECNEHDLSYYTELDIAFERARKKYYQS